MAIVTLEEVIQFLSMTESFKLKMVTEAINELIPDLCGRVFDSATYTEKLFLRFPNLVLSLSNYPIISSITSLANKAGTTVTPLDTDLAAGLVMLETDYWDGVHSDATIPVDIFDIIYPAGYSTMPKMLKIAAFAIIEDRMEIGDTSLTKQKLDDRSYERKRPLPPLAEEILVRYGMVI